MQAIAILDCNNFYASCERLFDASLRKKPVVVLSNNDGCVIARSNEAKAIGIKMGEPVFKCRDLLEAYQVKKLSANFPLYADLSDRVMSVLYDNVEQLEVYSIDEAFFSLGEHKSQEFLLLRAKQLQEKIERELGIAVSIGIARTKTLAKLANKIAKKNNLGIFSLCFDDEEYQKAFVDSVLSDYAIEDVWGLGFNYSKFLRAHAINTALDFAYANRRWVRQEMKVQGLRTCMELAGFSCLPLEQLEQEPLAKSIISSRSFGYAVKDLGLLQEAVANYIVTAAYKMRRYDKTTALLQVFLRGKNREGKKISLENTITLPRHTNASSCLISAAQKATKEIFDPNLEYKKAGVVLWALKDRKSLQLSLFASAENFAKENHLNKLIDNINANFGANTVFYGAMGKQKSSQKANWRAKQSYKSGAYTTSWFELPCIS
jgi:DNA polymerase V